MAGLRNYGPIYTILSIYIGWYLLKTKNMLQICSILLESKNGLRVGVLKSWLLSLLFSLYFCLKSVC